MQRRPGDDLGMVGAVLATAVDRLLEIAGERVGVVERLVGDADIAAVTRRPADGDRLLLLGREGEEQAQLLEHPFLDGRLSIPWPVTNRNPDLAEDLVDAPGGGTGRHGSVVLDSGGESGDIHDRQQGAGSPFG